MKHLIENGKPGDFRAVCRQARWEPLADVLALPRDQQPDTAHTRWDSRLKCEVIVVRCDFDTTDRAAFESHMRKVHGGGIFRYENGGLGTIVTQVRTYSPRLKLPALRGQLTSGPAEGRPFRPSSKAIAETVRTCATCGLIYEVREGGQGDEGHGDGPRASACA